MPEAVIVDAIRTPIGRAGKGSLKTVRADELAALPIRTLIERNPDVDFAADQRRADGRRLRGRGAGLQRRPQRGAAGRPGPPRPRLHRQPLLRLLADDDPDGVSRHPRRRGRPVHRRRGRGGLARRAGRRDDGGDQERQAQRLRGLALRRLHPDGDDRRERRRALQRHPRAAGRVGGDLPEPRRRGPRLRPLRRRDRARHRCRPTPRPTRRATRSRCPRRSCPRTTARGPGRRWRCWASSSPPSGPTAP